MTKALTAWAVWINGYGLRYNIPVKVKNDPSLGSYWAANGNDDVSGLGLVIDGSIASFATTNIQEAEAFVKGAATVINVIKNMSAGFKYYG